VTIPSEDPLYRQKRARLAEADLALSTQHTFQLSAAAPLPSQLLPFLRLTFATSEAELAAVRFDAAAAPAPPATEARAVAQLARHLDRRLAGYRTTTQQDEAILADPATRPRQTVAARLVRIEKTILQRAAAELLARPGAAEAVAAGGAGGDAGVRFE
jgi:histone-lysine N-methyltransferase SETD3